MKNLYSANRTQRLSQSARRRLFACLRMAHRCLGMKRNKLGLGLPSANGSVSGLSVPAASLMVAAGALAVGLILPSVASANTYTPTAGQGCSATGVGPDGIVRTTTANPVDGNGEYSSILGCGSSGGGNLLGATALGAFSSVTGNGGLAVGFGSAAALRASAFGLDATATGTNSLALGGRDTVAQGGATTPAVAAPATASGIRAIAIGTGSSAAAASSIALGDGASSRANNTIAIGTGASASAGGQPGSTATAIGFNARSTGGTALGFGSVAFDASTALGSGAQATGLNALAIGIRADFPTVASGDGSIAVGNATNATGQTSIAIGRQSQSTANGAIALGQSANASGIGALALGGATGGFGSTGAAQATGAASIALGAGDTTAEGGATTPVATVGAASSGIRAIALGTGSSAAGVSSIAIGDGAQTGAFTNAIAIGTSAQTGSLNSVALGFNATTGATGQNVAIGSGSTANAGTAAGGAVAIGRGNIATGDGAVALGDPSIANGQGAIAQGFNSIATSTGTSAGVAANGAVALGNTAVAAGQGSVSIGNTTTAGNAGSIAVGDAATVAAAATRSLALGSGANASVANSVALGSNSTTAAGVGVAGATIGGTAYTFAGGTPAGVVSVGGGGTERQIQNVAAGRLTTTSTDAVNGSQLAATNTQVTANTTAITAVGGRTDALGTAVATNLGGNATYNPVTGAVSAPTYNVYGSPQTNVGSAITALQTGAPVQYSDAAGTPTPLVPSNNVTLVGAAAGPVALHNVAAGTAATDAVNLSQLAGAIAANDFPIRSGDAGPFTTTATGVGALAVGSNAIASAGSTVVGNGATDNGAANATVLGNGASVTAGLAGSNVALGQGSTATRGAQANYTAIGVGAGQNSAGEVSVGSAGNERQITNVAAGSAATDAVNVAQLAALGQQTAAGTNNLGTTTAAAIGGGATYDPATSSIVGPNYQLNGSGQTFTNVVAGQQALANGAAGPVQYAVPGTPSNALNLVGVGGPVTLGNVAAGALTPTSTEAVNGAQLYATNQTVANLAAGVGGPFVSNNTNGRAGPTSTGVDAAAGGFGATAAGAQATAVGNTANASAAGASAFGFGATGTAANATALGQNANASLANSVALGSGSVTRAASDITGNPAVGVRNNAGAVATGSGNVVSVGAVGAERQIQNLAAGAVTVTSTDAVNGSQLFGVATSVAAVGAGAAAGLGGGSTYNPATGAFTGPSYALNGSGTTFTNAVSGIQAIASGAAGPVQYATPGTPSSNLNLVGTGAPVTLGNVAAGALTPTSTEAVNGSQLYATNQQVNTNTQNIVTTNQRTAAALGGGAGVDGNGLLTAPSYTVQGGTFNNVGGAISAIDRGLSNSVQYDTTASGDPNRQSITLNPGAGPVTIHNVAAGVALTDAANVGQVAAAVANTVQYGTNPNGTRSNTLALVGGDTSAPVRISNVASGVAATDAVNLGQLDAVANNLTGAYNNLAAIGSYQFQSAKRAAYAGTAIALAAAGLRYDDRPGKVSLAAGASGYHGTAGLAAGLGGTSEDGSLRYHVAASFSPNERKASAGIFGGLSLTLNSSDNAPSY